VKAAAGAPDSPDEARMQERPQPDVASLVTRLARGEESALHEAYFQQHARLRQFARRLVGDDAAADDLVHEVFVKLPRAIRRLDPEASLPSFLIGMAVNRARHHVRAAARRRRLAARLGREPLTDGVPADDVERRQLAAALVRALDGLPLDQRVAFVLCEVEERSSADAAAVVGVKDSTLRGRLFHAKRKLRLLLATWKNDDDGPRERRDQR
jgi:RNA polymerase sigma-70 factor (ECF subfamily)